MTKFSVNPNGKPWTRAMSNLSADLFRAQVHIGRDGTGGIENAAQLAAKEGWALSKARRVLKAGEGCGRFYFDMGVNVWKWTPEFADAGSDTATAKPACGKCQVLGTIGPCDACYYAIGA